MKNKIYFILLIMILIMNLLIIQVKAYSFTTTLTPDSSEVYKSGSDVVITVTVSDIDVGDNGINAFSAYLSYDTDVFETLTSDSIEGLNSWSATYSTDTGLIALTKNSFANDDEEIMQITLTTQSDLDEGTTGTVSLSSIQASNSEEDIDSANSSATIEIGTKTTISVTTSSSNTTDENTTNNTTNNSTSITISSNNTNNTTNNTNSSSNTTTSSSSTSNNTTTSDDDSDIPYTGTSDILLKLILGISLIAVLLFIKIKKIEDKE